MQTRRSPSRTISTGPAIVDRRRHLVIVAGKPRPQTATHWQIFMLLYRHRGDVVYNDRIRAELSEGRDRSSAELIREHVRQLRKVFAGSRYQIVNYRSLGYELIVADTLIPRMRRQRRRPATREVTSVTTVTPPSPDPRSYPRSVPLTTISTCRLPHCEQTSRSRQLRTVVSASCPCASYAGSGST
jgi:DNA-binding winged helix-turn-helix (wHTH) protein